MRDERFEAYLRALPEDKRDALERLRRQIRAALPRATEGFSYGMPAFLVDGKGVAWMGAFKAHCTLFPGSHRFTPDAPLPAALVRRIVREHAKEKAPSRARTRTSAASCSGARAGRAPPGAGKTPRRGGGARRTGR